MKQGLVQRRWLALVAILALAAPAFAAQIVEVGDPFGYDFATGVMTDHNGLQYKFRADGTIKVMAGGNSFVGLGVRGRVNGTWITKYVTDYLWFWSRSVDARGNQYFNSSVQQTSFGWGVNASFSADPNGQGLKFAYGFKNRMSQPVTNLKLFYLQTVQEGATLFYGDLNHSVSWSNAKHLTNETHNLNAVVPRVRFPEGYAFDFQDLIDDGFVVTDFFAGNASEFDASLPSSLVLIIGVTKGDGVLQAGQEAWADPTFVSDTAADALEFENSRKLVRLTDACSTLMLVYVNNSQIYMRMSQDNGTTFFNTTNLSKGGVDYAPAVVELSTKDVFVAYTNDAENEVVAVNLSYNNSCGWTNGTPFKITDTGAGSYLGWISLASCPNDAMFLTLNGEEYSVTRGCYRVCRGATDCSNAANWNHTNNTAGSDCTPFAAGGAFSMGGATAVCDSNNDYWTVVGDANANDGKLYRASSEGDGTWAWQTRFTLVPSLGANVPTPISLTLNSSNALFASWTNALGIKKAWFTYCDGGALCNDTANNWFMLNGSVGAEALSDVSQAGTNPSVTVFNDKPTVFFEYNYSHVNKNVVSRSANSTGTGWDAILNLTDNDYGNTWPAALLNSSHATRIEVAWVNGTNPYQLLFDYLLIAAVGGFEFNVTNVTHTSPIYETNSSLFNLTFDYNTTNISTIYYGHLVYDGVEFNASKADNGSRASFSKNHAAKFLTGSNNTAVVFRFSVHGNYSNGTAFVWNTSNYNQLVWYAWFWNAWTVSPTTLLPDEQALATLNTTQLYGTATVSAQITWAGTNYSMPVNGFNFTRWNTAPGFTTNFGAVGWLNVTYGSTSRINMTSNTSITVIFPSIVDCNATANKTILNFTVRDEESNASVNFSMDATFWLWDATRALNSTYSANWTSVLYAQVCIFPNWATGQVDSFQTYSSVNASQRGRFLWNVSVSNATTLNYTLYLLNSTETSQTIVYVKNNVGGTVANAIVKILRYFPATNTYLNVAEVLTDFEGKSTTYLQVEDTYYRFVVEREGVTELYSSPTIITCTTGAGTCPPYSVTLTLNPPTTPAYWNIFGSVTVACTFNNVSNYWTCVTSDPSSQLSSVNMVVLLHDTLNGTVVCNLSNSVFPAVQPCLLATNVTGNVYELRLLAYASDGTMVSLDPSFLDFRGLIANWGLMGYLLALLLITTMFFIGSFNPAVAVSLAYFGVIASWLLGLLPMGDNALTNIIGLGIVAGIIVWRLKT